MYHVMIVEDDPMVADIDRRYVEMDPAFLVDRLCKTGAEGLEYLRGHCVDLVILDYYTPAKTGMEFVDQMHAMGKYPAVIMVTSANDTAIIQSLLSRGVLDYLVKPFQYARFQQALGRFVQLRQQLEQNARHLDQQSIDRLISHPAVPSAAEAEPLPKGLNRETLALVRKLFAAQPERRFTCEEIAEQLHLSRITIRRYVSCMADQGELTSTMDYQTGGRPAIRYFLTPGPG